MGNRVSAPLPLSEIGEVEPEAKIARRTRYKLRDVAGFALPGEAVARCGKYIVGEFVKNDHPGEAVVKIADGRAFWQGLVTCGSVWHCPVCARKVGEVRRRDVQAVLDAHYGAGGVAYMAAFTIPHRTIQTCKELRSVVAKTWQRVQAGRAWKDAKAAAGVVGTVRALEVTHGGNGWHPHLHVLFLLSGDDPEAAVRFGDFLFSRWAAGVERTGYGKCSRRVWQFERARVAGQAGDYVVKWGADRELTAAQTKAAKGGGRNPFQILADIREYEAVEDVVLFAEYGRAFKGARQLTWSKGLREFYLGDLEETDQAVADVELPAARPVVYVNEVGFDEIRRRRLGAKLLEFIERDGGRGVIAFSAFYGVGMCSFRLGEAAYDDGSGMSGKVGSQDRDVTGRAFVF